MNRIEKFIEKFKIDSGNKELIEKLFTSGYCYHFAIMLSTLFGSVDYPEDDIMYNPVDNHFAFMHDFKLYDITGYIGLLSDDWEYWVDYKDVDKTEVNRIIKQCIYKEYDNEG